jgi:hypothetical protein
MYYVTPCALIVLVVKTDDDIYVGPRIPDMYPLHIGVLDMRDATLPLCTITATTLLCFW